MHVVTSAPTALERNRGILTDDEIATLGAATVAIAGVGGVGGRVAETLARLGVGSLRLCDPDTFSETNLNRQAGCAIDTLGRPKATVVADLCRSVSRVVEVEGWESGVGTDNAETFVAGADVVVDATDYRLPSAGLLLARASRTADIPVVLGVEVGFGSWHTVFTRGSATFERFFGLHSDVRPEDLDSGAASVPLWRWVASVPSYLDLGQLKRVEAGEIEAPVIAVAVELSSALIATDVIHLILGRPVVAVAPRLHLVDTATGRARTFRPSRARFALSALRAGRG